MASINELINLHNYKYGRPQGGKSALAPIIEQLGNRSEDRRSIEKYRKQSEIQNEFAQLAEQRQNKEKIEQLLALAGIDPTSFQKDQPPQGAVMSLPGGEYGDVQGRPLARQAQGTPLQRLAEVSRKNKNKGVYIADSEGGKLLDLGDVDKDDVVFKKESTQSINKQANDFFINAADKISQNSVKALNIGDAVDASSRIIGGRYGQIQREFLKNFSPDSPALQDWQKIKIVLTDAQLLNTAKTKGAISDKEMALFARAAANDDVTSIQAMAPVLNRLMAFIQSENQSIRDVANNLFPDKASSINSFFQGQESLQRPDLFNPNAGSQQSTPNGIGKEEAIAELRRRGLLK